MLIPARASHLVINDLSVSCYLPGNGGQCSSCLTILFPSTECGVLRPSPYWSWFNSASLLFVLMRVQEFYTGSSDWPATWQPPRVTYVIDHLTTRRVCYNHESNNNNAADDNTGKTNDCDEKLLSRVVAKPEGSLPLVSKPAISHNSELVPSVTFTAT